MRAMSSAAVSYTHLRAHETVLDLVCRLLLEKKNKHAYHMQAVTYGIADKATRLGIQRVLVHEEIEDYAETQ